MSEYTEDRESQLEFQYNGKLVKLDVGTENDVHEPRVRWQIGSTGKAGTNGSLRVPQDHSRTFLTPYMTMEVLEPRLVFGPEEDPQPSIEPEIAMLEGEKKETIVLPEYVADQLRERLEHLGTINPDGDQISTDPSKFPVHLKNPYHELESENLVRVGWDSTQSVMWYANQGGKGHPRPYQMEGDNLVWRRHNNAGFTGTLQEIVDELRLEPMD